MPQRLHVARVGAARDGLGQQPLDVVNALEAQPHVLAQRRSGDPLGDRVLALDNALDVEKGGENEPSQ